MRENKQEGVMSIDNLNRILEYIEKNLLEPLTPECIAGKFYMSMNSMNQLFRIVCNLSVMEYIRNRRISLAGQELLSTKEKIIDIAFKYGYETPEAFTKAFTRIYGFPPSVIRRTYPNLEQFQPVHIEVITIGGWVNGKANLTDVVSREQDSNKYISYNKLTKLNGGYDMNQTPKYYVSLSEMKKEKEWNALLSLSKYLVQNKLPYKVDGKTMIFAHGIEFDLQKICITFLWEDTVLVKEVFHYKDDVKYPYQGFGYFDTTYEGFNVRCMFYENQSEESGVEYLYENCDFISVDSVRVPVQSLEFYYQNAKEKDKYYNMVEEYLNKKLG